MAESALKIKGKEWLGGNGKNYEKGVRRGKCHIIW